MGGYGSGRPRHHGVIEQRLRLDVRMFRRNGWLVAGRAGTLRWSQHGEEVASARFTTHDDAVVLDYATKDEDGQAVPVRIAVPIRRFPCRFGGHRHYWKCPRCVRWCEVLAAGWGGRSWACRQCLRLRYACQGLAPSDRLQARAHKIFGRLRGDADFPLKPRWMRWRTLNRLVAQAQEFDARADRLFAGSCMRRFGMLPDDLAEWVTKPVRQSPIPCKKMRFPKKAAPV
jgi:hypothetical protein